LPQGDADHPIQKLCSCPVEFAEVPMSRRLQERFCVYRIAGEVGGVGGAEESSGTTP
jgi:hypothetical protein